MKLTPLGGVSIDLKQVQGASSIQAHGIPGEGGEPGSACIYAFDAIVHGEFVGITASDEATAQQYRTTALSKVAFPLTYGGYSFGAQAATGLGAVAATTENADGPSSLALWIAGAQLNLAFPTRAQAEEARAAITKAANEG